MSFPLIIFRSRNALPDWRSLVLYIWLLGLVLRLSHLILSTDNPLLYMPVLDEGYYFSLGKTIAGGQWVGENRVFFMDPLYGYFLSVIFFFLGDNLTTVRLIQMVIDAFNVVPVYLIGTRLWNKEAGLIAALSYAVYPVAFFYSLLILKTTLFVSMLLFFTLFLIYALEKTTSLRWYGLGIFASLTTYLRGNMVLLIPLVILFLPVYQGIGWRGFIRRSVLLFLGFMTLLSLGVYRNFRVSGEFVVLNSQAGRLLYSCNNPQNLTGRYNVPGFARPDPVQSEMDFHREAEQRKGAPLDPGEVSRYWTREAFGYVFNNPEILPRLLYNKIKGSVGNCEIANNHSFYMAAHFSPLLKWPPAPFALAFGLGLPGLVLGIRRNRKVTVLLIPLLAILTTILLFYTSSRFRMPAVPFLLIGAGITFNVFHEWIKRRKIVKALTLLVIIATCGFFSLSVACPKPTGTEEFLLAKVYWRQRDLDNARRFALKGLNDFPAQARFHVLLGMVAFARNQTDMAIRHNQEAVRLDSRNADALHNMGLVYLETNRPEQAIQYFQKALTIHERPDILFHLAMARDKKGDKKGAVENYRRYLETSKSTDPFRKQAKERLISLGFRPQI